MFEPIAAEREFRGLAGEGPTRRSARFHQAARAGPVARSSPLSARWEEQRMPRHVVHSGKVVYDDTMLDASVRWGFAGWLPEIPIGVTLVHLDAEPLVEARQR